MKFLAGFVLTLALACLLTSYQPRHGFVPLLHAAQRCDLGANIAFTASGNTKIITGVANQQIHVCSIMFSMNGAADVIIKTGTGTNCATGTASQTGTFPSITALVYEPPEGDDFPVGVDACLNLSANVTGGGKAKYALF